MAHKYGEVFKPFGMLVDDMSLSSVLEKWLSSLQNPSLFFLYILSQYGIDLGPIFLQRERALDCLIPVHGLRPRAGSIALAGRTCRV